MQDNSAVYLSYEIIVNNCSTYQEFVLHHEEEIQSTSLLHLKRIKTKNQFEAKYEILLFKILFCLKVRHSNDNLLSIEHIANSLKYCLLYSYLYAIVTEGFLMYDTPSWILDQHNYSSEHNIIIIYAKGSGSECHSLHC